MKNPSATTKNTTAKQKARAAYIKAAKIILSGDIALVWSEQNTRYYEVHLDGQKALDCECRDFVYRHSHCKHQEAVEVRVAPKKARRSATNAELVASLQVAEGVKIRKVRNQTAIKVSVPAPKIVCAACGQHGLCSPECEAEAQQADVELPELPVVEEEEFTEELAELWTEEEILRIREAAKPQVQAPHVLPQAKQYENAPLNGGRSFASVLRKRS